MGFDLSGIKAKNKKGEYFRNNVWWWRRLWGFACSITDGYLNEELGHSNSGYAVKGREHKLLVEKLKYALANKVEFQEMIDDAGFAINNYKKAVNLSVALRENNKEKEEEAIYGMLEPEKDDFNYPFDWGNVKEFYEFCKNNEGFEIW